MTKDTARAEFEWATWKHANQTKSRGPILYDAGKLGFCLLVWERYHWENKWFDKAVKLPEKYLKSPLDTKS